MAPPQITIAFAALFDTPSSSAAAVCFDTNSFTIGIDTLCSVTMGEYPDQFDDLVLSKSPNVVQGIEGGLAIEGTGTFKFNIEDNGGRTHLIQIPNSKLVPGLKYALLSPQHWAQEAQDHHPMPQGTRVESNGEHCVLIWGQSKFRRSVRHNQGTNTPTFQSASSAGTYRAFVAYHEAMDAQLHQRERVLIIPGLRPRVDKEYIADENLFFDTQQQEKEAAASEGACPDDETIPTDNLVRPDPPTDEGKRHVEQRGPLAFDPMPPLEDIEQADLIAANKQAEIMRWHHRLGHLPFSQIHTLTRAGEIPKKLAKVTPPICAGCLYGAMTKVRWQNCESADEHQVFVVTWPGQCVSVNQMIST